MKCQLFVFLKQSLTADSPIFLASGFQGGILVNITEEKEVLSTVQFFNEFGHHCEVAMLDDDEPWPTIQQRRESFIGGI